MPEQKYVLGRLVAEVDDNGAINGELTDLTVYEGRRPVKAEDFGADPEQIALLNSRMPRAKINTLVRPGVGAGITLFSLYTLRLAQEKWMEKFMMNVKFLKQKAIIGPRRNIRAGGTWLVQDTCAGILEEKDFIAGAIKEMVEIGFYDVDGWLKYILPVEYSQYQDMLDQEQKSVWQLFGGPDFKPIKEEMVNILKARDSLNGFSVILSGEENSGSAEIALLTSISLPIIEKGWLTTDLETGSDDERGEFLLNRKVLVIVERQMKTPIQIGFGDEGMDLDYPAIAMEGENLLLNTNAKVRSIMAYLGWI